MYFRTFALCLLLGSLCAPALAQEDEIFWHSRYEDALKEAQQTGKPIFLEFRCSP